MVKLGEMFNRGLKHIGGFGHKLKHFAVNAGKNMGGLVNKSSHKLADWVHNKTGSETFGSKIGELAHKVGHNLVNEGMEAVHEHWKGHQNPLYNQIGETYLRNVRGDYAENRENKEPDWFGNRKREREEMDRRGALIKGHDAGAIEKYTQNHPILGKRRGIELNDQLTKRARNEEHHEEGGTGGGESFNFLKSAAGAY